MYFAQSCLETTKKKQKMFLLLCVWNKMREKVKLLWHRGGVQIQSNSNLSKLSVLPFHFHFGLFSFSLDWIECRKSSQNSPNTSDEWKKKREKYSTSWLCVCVWITPFFVSTSSTWMHGPHSPHAISGYGAKKRMNWVCNQLFLGCWWRNSSQLTTMSHITTNDFVRQSSFSFSFHSYQCSLIYESATLLWMAL